jgi:hypothetical protein
MTKDEHWFEGKYHCIYKIDSYMSEDSEGTYGMVGVRDVWINKAIKSRKFFVVVAPKGSQQFNPKMIKKTMKDKLFPYEKNYPGNPMYFYPLMIKHNGLTELERWGVYL